MESNKRLQISISSFRKIIDDNYLYVDKTKEIYDLINDENYQFLSRPRRFGKSLLISTLEEIFLGNKELFKGLWIYDSNYNWAKYTIVKLDFSRLQYNTPQNLYNSLYESIDIIAEQYNIELKPSTTLSLKITRLFIELFKINKVVVLIDEYDVPVISKLDNIDLAQQNLELIREFFKTLKSLDQYIHKLFITGVSKIAKSSVFSGANNVKDISLSPKFSNLLGYTQKELNYYFDSYIKIIETRFNIKDLQKDIKAWYNGFRFANLSDKVYNPFSIASFFNDSQEIIIGSDENIFKNYWFKSGSPKFLVNLSKHESNRPILLKTIEELNNNSSISINEDILDPSEITDIRLDAVLFQTGYLTIDKVIGNNYILKWPNDEIRDSLEKYLIGSLVNIDEKEIGEIGKNIKDALINNNLAQFFLELDSLFADISYLNTKNLEREGYYHAIIHAICKVAGIDFRSEKDNSIGRTDFVIFTDKYIYIFEWKSQKNSAEAINQIEDKKYYKPYLSDNRKVILVGANFTVKENKELVITWESKDLVHLIGDYKNN